MQIKRMETCHIEQVAALEREIFTHPWSEASIRKAFEKEENIYIVAAEGQTVCGYCGMWCSFETADLCNIAVAPDKRGQGIAGEILQYAKDACRQKGVESILLEVREANASARSLYQKNAFKEISRRKQYYKDPVEDAVIMQCFL